MSLRTRLILAFFLLSVVPLGAVTFYSYTTNVNALREAAEREADLLAGELGQRMQLVTAQLSERVEHLMDIAELQAAADAASQTDPVAVTAAASAPAAETKPTVTVVSSQTLLSDQIAKSLGETALLLNNVRLSNLRGGGGRGGRGGQPPPGVVPPPPPVATVGRAIPTFSAAPATPTPSAAASTSPTPTPTPTPRPTAGGDPTRGRAPRPGPGGGDRTLDPSRVRGGGSSTSQRGTPPQTAPVAGAPGAPRAPGTSNAPATPQVPTITATKDASGNLMIDMGPLRRELFQQVLPAGKRFEELSSEERQRLAAEVNQRLIGIQQGLKIGAAELEKRAAEAEQAATAKAAAAKQAAAAKPTAVKPDTAALKRRSSLSGSQIAVNVERNGEVVRSLNAEINVPNLVATVFSNTPRDRGEIPFAVGKDGTVYARSAAEKVSVAAFGDVAQPGGPAVSRMRDWIVVTTEDQSGSGLRLGIARPVGDSLASLRRSTARNAGLGLLFIAIALAGIVPLSASLTRNLSTLSEAVGRIAHGDYRARVPVKSNDEVGQLALAFNQMASDVERHQHTAVEQERLRRELELGRQIQNEMLPHAPLNLGLTQVQGISVPAREVGGDFFNYFVLDDGQIALLMGDVSGKGVGAALLMANIQASLKIRLDLGQNLAAVADSLDRDIEANSPGPVYATLFIGMLDPTTRRLRYVNAGHNPQYVLRRQGGLERMAATGLPVGLIAGRGYTEQFVQLAAGDLLFFYTDGCVEAENEQGEMFGMERLDALLLAAVGSADPLHRIESALLAYRGKSEPSDDATLMTVKVG